MLQKKMEYSPKISKTILAIELADRNCTVALSHRGVLKELNFSKQRGRGLLQAISTLLNEDNAKSTLAAILIGIGPGSYTGLRIACTAGKMLGYGLGIPCYGISSFEACAWKLQSKEPINFLIDAYRKQFYHAKYEIKNNELKCTKGPRIIEQNAWPKENEYVTPEHFASDIIQYFAHLQSQYNNTWEKQVKPAEPLYLRPPAFKHNKSTP